MAEDMPQIRTNAVSQTVRTPLHESGIQMTPDFPTRLTLSSFIQRAWSTLWGWTGSALARLRCTRGGMLYVVPPDFASAVGVVATGNIPDQASFTVDLGTVVDHVFTTTTNSIGGGWIVDFSVDNVTFVHARFVAGTVAVGQFSVDMWVSARYVRYRQTNAGVTAEYLISGATFPRE